MEEKTNDSLINDYEEKIKSLENEIQNITSNLTHYGEDIICINCKNIWKIRKQRGLPSRCSRCSSIDLELFDVYQKKEQINQFKELVRKNYISRNNLYLESINSKIDSINSENDNLKDNLNESNNIETYSNNLLKLVGFYIELLRFHYKETFNSYFYLLRKETVNIIFYIKKIYFNYIVSSLNYSFNSEENKTKIPSSEILLFNNTLQKYIDLSNNMELDELQYLEFKEKVSHLDNSKQVENLEKILGKVEEKFIFSNLKKINKICEKNYQLLGEIPKSKKRLNQLFPSLKEQEDLIPVVKTCLKEDYTIQEIALEIGKDIEYTKELIKKIQNIQDLKRVLNRSKETEPSVFEINESENKGNLSNIQENMSNSKIIEHSLNVGILQFLFWFVGGGYLCSKSYKYAFISSLILLSLLILIFVYDLFLIFALFIITWFSSIFHARKIMNSNF